MSQNLGIRIQQEDKVAEEEFVRLFRPYVFINVRKKLGNKYADIQDLVNEILMASLIKIRVGAFDSEKGSLKIYVWGITNNKLKDYFKAAGKREIPSDKLPDIPVDADGTSNLEKNEEYKRLHQQLEKLPSKYKEVLYLRFFENMKVSEISKKMGLAPRRVSERINYALMLLKKKYNKEKRNLSIFTKVILINIMEVCHAN